MDHFIEEHGLLIITAFCGSILTVGFLGGFSEGGFLRDLIVELVGSIIGGGL